jgi:hypothetical protein
MSIPAQRLPPRGWTAETEEQKKEAEAKANTRAEWVRLHVAVFAGGPGRELLETYHRIYVDRACAIDATEAELRHNNTRRLFVQELEKLTNDGLKSQK